MDRTGGGALMRRLVLDDMKHLIFAKLDRLGRNVKDALGVLELLSERGESITTQGHMGKLILTVLLPVAL